MKSLLYLAFTSLGSNTSNEKMQASIDKFQSNEDSLTLIQRSIEPLLFTRLDLDRILGNISVHKVASNLIFKPRNFCDQNIFTHALAKRFLIQLDYNTLMLLPNLMPGGINREAMGSTR